MLTFTHLFLLLQLTAEGLSNLWWTPTDCSGTAMQILMSPITYDITPPTLAIIQKTGKSNVTLAQSAVTATTAAHARLLRHYSRKLQYFTLSPTSSSSTVTYGANVVFSFSEAVEGFAEGYAFIKGGELSSSGLNETVSQQQYTATIVADNTKSAMVMVTGSKAYPPNCLPESLRYHASQSFLHALTCPLASGHPMPLLCRSAQSAHHASHDHLHDQSCFPLFACLTLFFFFFFLLLLLLLSRLLSTSSSSSSFPAFA